jgi:hypothetical protein
MHIQRVMAAEANVCFAVYLSLLLYNCTYTIYVLYSVSPAICTHTTCPGTYIVICAHTEYTECWQSDILLNKYYPVS